MPGRGTQQNLRNFEAISLRLEPLAMVNAEILSATKNWAERTRSALSLTALWSKVGLVRSGHWRPMLNLGISASFDLLKLPMMDWDENLAFSMP